MEEWRLSTYTDLVDLCAGIDIRAATQKQLSRLDISVFRCDME